MPGAPLSVEIFFDQVLDPVQRRELRQLVTCKTVTNPEIAKWLNEVAIASDRSERFSSQIVRRWRQTQYRDGAIALRLNEAARGAQGIEAEQLLAHLASMCLETAVAAAQELQKKGMSDLSAKELFLGGQGWVREARNSLQAFNEVRVWLAFRQYAIEVLEEVRHEVRSLHGEDSHYCEIIDNLCDSVADKFCNFSIK